MRNVVIYSTAYCPFCTAVKQLFDSKGVAYEEIDLSDNRNAFEELKRKNDWRTVPQVFIGDEFIGGYEETRQLDRKGELDRLLEGD